MTGQPATLPTTVEPLPTPRSAQRTFPIPAEAPAGTRRSGVVFVHGIGTQVARETLFDWARPIIDVLGEWRREYDKNHPDAPIGENPVGSASVSDASNPWIEVDVPAFGGRDREQWLFTESWWAGDVRPPSFTDAARYMLRQIPGIAFGIAKGYGVREERRDERLRKLITDNEGSNDPVVQKGVAEIRRSLSGRWRITDALDGLWRLPGVRTVLAYIGTSAALLVLGIYAALHAIPIGAIRRRVEIAMADTFIVEWFGDLPVLLDDQSQSAAIRTRLVERVEWLRSHGCTDVVLVAHSGGTIVSFATLLRYDQDEFTVAKLVTLGEAIKLGWRLEQEARDWLPGNSIRGDVKVTHPDLKWVDVWASYDPAPSGELIENEGSPLIAVERFSDKPADPRIHVESRPVTNFMHLGLDHGGYWANDEGFLIPLIRHIDDPTGDGSASRFYGDSLARTVRTERRRRRVALLLAWRWTALAFGIASVVAAAIRTSLTDAGNAVAGVFGLLPGHELVSGTIDGIGNAVAVVFNALGLTAIPEWLADAGPVLLGALIPVVAVFWIYGRGVGSWTAHDTLERVKIRREQFGPAGHPSARGEAVLLVGGLIAVLLAALVVPLGVLLIWLAVVGIEGLVVRRFVRI
jgi:pimeloyl-ACP methyl ester carboxylesterase